MGYCVIFQATESGYKIYQYYKKLPKLINFRISLDELKRKELIMKINKRLDEAR